MTRVLRFRGFVLVRDTSRQVCSDRIAWMIYHSGYFYHSPSLIKLIWQYITEFKQDKHLIG